MWLSAPKVDLFRLLRTNIPVFVGAADFGELWQSPEMVGWAESLGSRIKNAWRFLHQLWDTQPWLKHFFVSRQELYSNLRVYLLFASLLELSKFISQGGKIEQLNDESYHLIILPAFLTPLTDLSDIPNVSKLISKAVPDRSDITRICGEFGCEQQKFREAWPHYYTKWLRDLELHFGHRIVVLHFLRTDLR